MSESLCRCVRAPWCPQRAGGFVCQQRLYPILAYLRGIKNPPAVGSRFKGGFPKTRCKSRPGGTYRRSTGEPAWDRVLGRRTRKGLLLLHRFVLMRGFGSVIRMWGLRVGCWGGRTFGAALGLMPSTPVLLLQLGPAQPLKVYKCALEALAKFLSLLGAFPLVLLGSSLVDCSLLPS